jgi:pimeloyl-ACP methyl ester carboxylesterase
MPNFDKQFIRGGSGHIPILALLLLAITVTAPAQAPVSRGFLKAGGGRLYYETAGKGRVLVFIHGGQMDRRIWDDQFNTFAKRYKVIRYDVRGYGKSSIPTKPYSNVEDLQALLKSLRVQQATLIGLSLGGGISIDFALAHPSLIDALVLAGPGLGGFEFKGDSSPIVEAARDEGPSKAAELWLKDPYMIPAMENPAISKRVRQLATENSHVWLENPILERPLKPFAVGRLSEIHAPTLIIIGERDVPDIQAIVDKLASEVRGAKKEVIRGAGHIVNMERPDEFNRALREFLNQKASS